MILAKLHGKEPLEMGFPVLAPAPRWLISSFHLGFGKECF